jgi:hypothetical protein
VIIGDLADHALDHSGVHPPGSIVVFAFHTHPFRRCLRLDYLISVFLDASFSYEKSADYLRSMQRLLSEAFPSRGAVQSRFILLP